MKLFTALATPRIDAENGIIRSVSLMEIGDAKGHFDKKGRQVIIDDVTLEQLFKECKKLGKIKLKANHGSGVFEVIGWADNFALQANKVTADVHIYEAESNRARILEIAEQNPTHMGISMEFTGEDKPRGEVCMSRCDGVLAAALVDDPAANSSLFSAKAEESNNTNNNTKMENEEEKDEPTLADVMSKFEELNTRLTALEAPPVEEEAEKEAEKEFAGDIKANNNKVELAGDIEASGNTVKLADKDEEKKAEMAANRVADMVIKKLSSQLGLTKLSKPGIPAAPAKVKTYSEHVSEIAEKQFSGDRVKAEGHILTNFAKFPEAKKAYEASRNVKTA